MVRFFSHRQGTATDCVCVRQPTCITCGGTVIEYDAAAGNGFCVACGTVVEENTIVNEVAFGETSNGAAMVQGSIVAMGSSALPLLYPSFFLRLSGCKSRREDERPVRTPG